MEISLYLYAELSKYVGPVKAKKKIKIVVHDNYSVEDLMDIVGIPPEEVGTVVVNGRLANNDYCFKERDEVRMFSPLECA